MKAFKILLITTLLSCISQQVKSYTLIELMIFMSNNSSNTIIYLPDSLYNNVNNVTDKLNVQELTGTNVASNFYTVSIELNDTNYFEYLGTVVFDATDTLTSKKHAYRLKRENIEISSYLPLIYFMQILRGLL